MAPVGDRLLSPGMLRMAFDDNTLCECGEGIEQHTSVGKYLMCPDNIHEFYPPRCGECDETFTTRDERAEVVLLADPTGDHRVVHEPCYDRERMVLA